MGYTVSIIIKDAQKLQKCVKFMRENQKSTSQIFPEIQKENYFSWCEYGKGLSYILPSRKRYSIGFNFNCASHERHYMMSLIKWMALHMGDREDNKPYYIYDYDIELLDHDVDDGWQWTDLDQRVMKQNEEWWPANYETRVKDHLKELTIKWNVLS